MSGRVNPGVKLAPAGITMRELIAEYCGGMQEGHEFKGFLPGGASGGVLPESLADIPLDFGTLEPHGTFVGSHAVVILSQHDDMKAVAFNLMKFFEDESCGQARTSLRRHREGREADGAGAVERRPADIRSLRRPCGTHRSADLVGGAEPAAERDEAFP